MATKAATKAQRTVKEGDVVICMIAEYGGQPKSDFDCNVLSVREDGVDVVYLSGYRSRNDFVPTADILAVVDKNVPRVKVPGTCYEGHFVLLKDA